MKNILLFFLKFLKVSVKKPSPVFLADSLGSGRFCGDRMVKSPAATEALRGSMTGGEGKKREGEGAGTNVEEEVEPEGSIPLPRFEEAAC